MLSAAIEWLSWQQLFGFFAGVVAGLAANVLTIWVLGPWLLDKVVEQRRLNEWRALSLRCRGAVRVVLIKVLSTTSFVVKAPSAVDFRRWAESLGDILRRRPDARGGVPPDLLSADERPIVAAIPQTAAAHRYCAEQLAFLLQLFEPALPASTRGVLMDAVLAARECAEKLRPYEENDAKYLAAQVADYLQCSQRASLAYAAVWEELDRRVEDPVP